MNNLRLVVVNTTAFEEEDLRIITDLTEDEIIQVVNPLVLAERDDEGEYDNESLLTALCDTYPTNHIEMVIENDRIVI